MSNLIAAADLFFVNLEKVAADSGRGNIKSSDE